MDYGSKPTDDGNLILTLSEKAEFDTPIFNQHKIVRPFIGSSDSISGKLRFCLWINDETLEKFSDEQILQDRLKRVQDFRAKSKKKATSECATTPHKFQEIRQKGTESSIVIPSHSSENRDYLPTSPCPNDSIISNSAFAFHDSDLWNLGIVCSRVHLVWIATVCGKIKTDYRYSNTLGWNTFPVPDLTEKNKEDLTRCSEDILLAREAHFPATIADLYDPEKMPENLREAHERNDEVLERIYIGRRFKNDTERLEKLFELYIEMTEAPQKLEFNS